MGKVNSTSGTPLEPLDLQDIALLHSITCDSGFSLAKVVCILRGRARRPKARDFDQFFPIDFNYFVQIA